ncbi:MAG: HTH domain-containing protein [Candidatus Kariarchaeaceae archaeon]|jgi:DNA-binding MarR family transcriptional regulator
MLVTKSEVLVTEVRPRKIPKLNHVSYKILEILENAPDHVTIDEILKKIDISKRTIRYRLWGLEMMDKIIKTPNLDDLRSFKYGIKRKN